MRERSTHYTLLKWFLIGFGLRLSFIVVVLLNGLVIGSEALMLYLADLPTMLVLTLAEEILPTSWNRFLAGGDPWYIPMNFIGSVLWGGIFMLIPLARNAVFYLRRSKQNVN